MSLGRDGNSPKSLSDEDVIAAIYVELDRTTEFGNHFLAQNRKSAWDAFLNRARGDEIEGRSQVHDTSVRDTVHSLLAAIMPTYASTNPISFPPDGPQDIDQAAAESAAVNSIFSKTPMGDLELRNALQDCLLFRNGVMRVWIDERREVTQRSFLLADTTVADILAQAPPGEDWEHTETDEDGVASFTVTGDRQVLKIEAVEPARFYVNPNQTTQDLQQADFMAEVTYLTRSDLRELGVSAQIAGDLPHAPDDGTTTTGSTNIDQLARFIDGVADSRFASTFGQETIECYWISMRMDRDGDGLAEQYLFLVSNRELLLDDPVAFFSYASGTGWPVPHRWSGLSVYDLLKQTQNQRTNILRQVLDNMNKANNQRPVADPGETEFEDLATGAPGRGIRSRNPGNVTWMPVQDIISNSLGMLEYTSKVRSEQSGAALELASGEANLIREASGISVDMQLQPREAMAAAVSKNIASTLINSVFLLIHEVLRTQWKSPIMIQTAGDWAEVRAREWQPRTKIVTNVGLSAGERRRQTSSLQQIIQMQMGMIQGGTANITTNWNQVHRAIMDWAVSAEMPSPEQYFLDPDGQESRQGQQVQSQQAQAQSDQQQQLQQMQIELEQHSAQIEDQKLQLAKYEHDTQLAHDYWENLLDADTADADRQTVGETQARELGGPAAAGSGAQNGAGQSNQG